MLQALIRGGSGKLSYIMCRPIGKFLCLLWQHCRPSWSFTCEPCSFDSGRTGFFWVRRVWNGSADPKSGQMPHSAHVTTTLLEICSGIYWTIRRTVRTSHQRFPLVSSPKETSGWENVRRWWWGARRSYDVFQRAGGRLLWLRDTEAGSKT